MTAQTHASLSARAPALVPVKGGGDQTARPAGARPGRQRLAWLDALRGIGALCVVYEHFGARVLPQVHAAVFSVVDPGVYGVLVFFLISGYIVPASLERKGSVRTFWISRLFRLFPLYFFVIGVTLLFAVFGLASLNTGQNVTAAGLGHLFMLNDLLGSPNLIVVIWTLSYEMVFYLLLTALFTRGLHQRSGTLAITFAAGALLLGGLLPIQLLSRSFGLTPVAVAADVLVLGGLAVAIAARGLTRTVAACVAGGSGLILLVLNEHKYAYEGLTILALMFTGTMLYRAQQRESGRGRAIAIAVGVFAATMAAGAWHIPALEPGPQSALQAREWVAAVALAGLTFAGGLALQKLRVPSGLAWLGLVSYSVYLLLPEMLDLYDSIPFPASYQHAYWLQGAAYVLFTAALLGCAALTYYLIEAPMQRLGKRVAARLDARFGTDARPAHADRAVIARRREPAEPRRVHPSAA